MSKHRLLSALDVVATAPGLYLLYRVLQRYDVSEVATSVATAPRKAKKKRSVSARAA